MSAWDGRRRALHPGRHHVRVAIDEGEERRAGTVDVDRRQPVVVALLVLLDGVVQDHPGGAARGGR